ncbi:type II secretion system protein GspG [Candidatus Dependentiae bacterium]
MICVSKGAPVRRTAKAGFSIMELLIYLAILGVILAVAVPGFMQMFEKAKKDTAKSSMKILRTAIDKFKLDTGVVPERLRDLVRKPAPSGYYEPEMISSWQDGGYLKDPKVPVDPWKSRYKYEVTPGGRHPYELFSYGPSRRGAPKAEWISVWDD